jgi:uncharacterized RmlC-like cupin family protein
MSNAVRRVVWQPKKADREKGRWLVDSSEFVMPDGFAAVRSAVVGFAPSGWAANHRHKRREVLFGLAGELYLIWRDLDGERHEEKMLRDDGRLQVFLIAPQIPHLVENHSATASAALYEWSDLIDEAVPLGGEESLR